MEECETLCSRIAIMVAGEKKDMDTIQNLKAKFAGGSVITVKLSINCEAVCDRVFESIKREFPEVKLKEKNLTKLTLHIPSKYDKLSKIFEKMNIVKESNSPIVDFSVTQMSLQQVFLYFSDFDANRPIKIY